MSLKIVSVALVLLGVAYAEVVQHRSCDEASASVCPVSEVRINPCSDPKACKLFKGKTSTISFDFTPNFSANKLVSGLFWASHTGDVPFADMYQADGCQYTSCPVSNGQQQTLNYSLRIDKKLPNGQFTFKWKLWNDQDESQVCCFLTDVLIRK